ncbi:MAG: bile acid:sodium symporter [Candidatus Nanoarchaeia archaeon]
MWSALSFIKKKLVWFVAAFMVLGLINGYFFPSSYLKPLIIPLTILMVYPMMVSMNIKAIFVGCSYKLQGATQAINFIFIPLFAFGLGMLFFPDNEYFAFGLLLMALLPTSGMTISWTGFAKGNTRVAVKMTIIGLIAGVLLTPFYGWLLMGRVISIPLIDTIKQIALVVIIPLTLGVITQILLRRWQGEAKFNRDIKPKFPEISLLGVLGIIFVAMSLKSKTIIADPLIIVKLVIPLIIFYGVNYVFTSFIGKTFFSRGDGIALVYGTVMRNLSIALAIAVSVFETHGAEMALVLSVAYLLQIKSAALYMKVADKIFGAAEEKVGHVMQEGIFSLHDTATLQDAIKMLDEEHIHSVAVLSQQGKPKGLITSDIVINQLAENKPLETSLKKLKLEPIVNCKVQSPLDRAIKQMKRKHNYKFIVTDDNNKPTGVLTETDIINRFAGGNKDGTNKS